MSIVKTATRRRQCSTCAHVVEKGEKYVFSVLPLKTVTCFGCVEKRHAVAQLETIPPDIDLLIEKTSELIEYMKKHQNINESLFSKMVVVEILIDLLKPENKLS